MTTKRYSRVQKAHRFWYSRHRLPPRNGYVRRQILRCGYSSIALLCPACRWQLPSIYAPIIMAVGRPNRHSLCALKRVKPGLEQLLQAVAGTQAQRDNRGVLQFDISRWQVGQRGKMTCKDFVLKRRFEMRKAGPTQTGIERSCAIIGAPSRRKIIQEKHC